jgi:Transcriptional regulator containing an amidase domain and an AraC-type DNA-binding HTH domain
LRNISNIEFHAGSKEERLPDFASDFPYIASHADFIGRFVPWHWHKAVELFYMQSGTLEYYTPKGKKVFPTGSGGLVNSNVLHMTKPQAEGTIQLLHIFDPSFIAGEQRCRIEQRYITPVIAHSQLEIIALYPDRPEQAPLLNTIRESITFISRACGLGSSSYFGKMFREHAGCTPAEYRRKWRDNDI